MLSQPVELEIADYALDAHTHVVEVKGEVDLYSAPEMKQRTLAVIALRKRDVLVDLSGVRLIDSTGLGVLLTALKQMRAVGGTLSLVVTDYDLERLLEMTGLDGSFPIYRSRDDAVAALADAR